MKPGSYSTQKLAAEASALEARLTALKLELQKDRAKRDAAAAAAMASGSKESIWSNSQRGPLRQTAAAGGATAGAGNKAATPPVRGLSRTPSASSKAPPRPAAPAPVPPARTIAAAAARGPNITPASNQSSRLPSASLMRPTSSSSTTSTTSSSGSLDTKRSDTPTKAVAAKPQWLQQLKQQQASSLEHSQVAAAACILGSSDRDCGSAAQGASQHIDGCSLLEGSYNEAEAANSFQEALRQWQQAGSSSGSGGGTDGGDSCAGSSTAGRNAGKAIAATRGQQCTQQQQHSGTSTGTSSGQGPTQRPVNASVEAFLQRLSTRSSSSIPAPAAAVGQHTHLPTPEPYGSVVDAASNPHAEPPLAACVMADATEEEQAEVSSGGGDDLMTDAGHVVDESQPFEAFLQEAEQLQVAAMFAAGGQRYDHGNSRAAQHGGSSASGSGGAAAGAADASYHERLASMLDAVEQLEQQLHERSKPAQRRVPV